MALLSHLARLGSSDPVELRQNMADLIDGFDLSRFGSAPTKFDVADPGLLSAKLLHSMNINRVQGDLDALEIPTELAAPFWEMARENIETRADLVRLWALCRDGVEPLIDAEDIDFIAEAMNLLPAAPRSDTSWKEWTTAVKEATGRKGKGLFMPLRKALTGMSHGPDMSKLLPLLQNIGGR